MNEIRWNHAQAIENTKIEQFSKDLNNLDRTLTEVLIKRGIDTFDSAKQFFRPSLEEIHDPFLMKDMDKAVDRIEEAISKKQNILVYGDYDVDGTTAVSLVYSFLSKYYSNISYYIPDRYKEGYGVSFQGIDYAADNDFSLIIALDCGIKAIDKVDYATKKGVDFIICDHHRPGDTIPKAVAVLDPKRVDCEYPYKELSGCGVGFKLMQAFAINREIDFKELHPLLDLLAVSIAADIVHMTGENRILAYYGLKWINAHPRPGISAMIKSAQLRKNELTITDVVFTIAPRINAAGRIESGLRAVELLITTSEEEAEQCCTGINNNNTERKELDKGITEEALEYISSDPEMLKRKSTVLFNPSWHKGVIGIVASRVIESYYKPTIVLTESNGKATGSARSVAGFDVYNAIDACSDHLEQFGGHMYAAGLTMKLEKLNDFINAFEKYVSSTITEDQLTPVIDIDALLELDQINDKFYSILKQFAPFGPMNMRPVFRSDNVELASPYRIVGENHLKLSLRSIGGDVNIDAIGFKMAHFADSILDQTFSITYVIDENEWRGKKSLQLILKDIKLT
jgi:single-stranded-DNA-specific exonuclease